MKLKAQPALIASGLTVQLDTVKHNILVTTDRDYYLICDLDLNLLHRLHIESTNYQRLVAHVLNFLH